MGITCLRQVTDSTSGAADDVETAELENTALKHAMSLMVQANEDLDGSSKLASGGPDEDDFSQLEKALGLTPLASPNNEAEDCTASPACCQLVYCVVSLDE